MKASDYHGALDALGMACAQAGVRWVTNPLTAGDSARSAVSRKARVLRQHIRLARSVKDWREDRVLVREFSTVPLWMTSRLWQPVRERTWFIINHNVQWALHRPLERRALLDLERQGFRFLFWEIMPEEVFADWGFHKDRHVTFPLPAGRGDVLAPVKKERTLEDYSVGLVGEYRPEKQWEPLMRVLLDALPRPVRIVVGVPNPEAVPARSLLHDPRVEWRNTASREAYERLLSSCAVIVQNYAEDRYRYRPSGLVADAVGCGTPVLTPAYPVLQHQVSWPVPVGHCYRALEDVPGLIEDVRRKSALGEFDFAAYRKARGVDALAARLQQDIRP